MSPITMRRGFALLLSSVLLVVAGCGTPADQSAGFDADIQQHIDNWRMNKHVSAAQADLVSCKACHGEDLLGGISAVSCERCHVNGMISLTGCTSCHGNPPVGATAPDRRGAHAVHNTLRNVSGVCATCHSGSGSGTLYHSNGVADVVLVSTYQSASGPAVRNADGTCSNVSCHGGKRTPAWLTGAIDANTECDSCHAFGTTEANSYASGQHGKHVTSFSMVCTKCHDATKLSSSHFRTLNTSTMEGPASATLLSSLSYTGGSCTPICHTNQPW